MRWSHLRMFIFLNRATLAIISISSLLPLVWMLSISLMDTKQGNSLSPNLFPSSITFSHYKNLFSTANIWRSMLNSFAVASAITFTSVICNSLAGYSFAKIQFKGRDFLIKIVMISLLVPVQVAVVPLFLMMKVAHLIDSYFSLVLPSLASPFGVLLIRQSAQSIPDSILDSARLDGAGELQIFYKIVLPLLHPVIITLAIFSFLASWNDFMWPLFVMTDQAKFTMPLTIASLAQEHSSNVPFIMTGAVVTTLPVLIVYVVLNRFFFATSFSGVSLNEKI